LGELIGKNVRDLVYAEDQKLFDEQRRARQEGKRSTYELRYKGKERVVHTLISVTPLMEKGKFSGAIGFHTDFTEKVRLEGELERQRMRAVHASKMAGLGEMAAGVAHEINNPLAIIDTNASHLVFLAERGDLRPEQVLKACQSIQLTVTRISGIVKALRSFARDAGNDPFRSEDVGQILSSTLALCRSRFQHHQVELIVDPLAPGLTIECRAVQISQLLLNILNNAFDAVRTLGEKWIQVTVTDLGDAVEFAIADSGRGIPPEIQDKLTTPFFTTKEVGQGSGLGLSVSVGLVEAHHGALFLDSRHPNTRFVVRLPKHQQYT
jgi:C4-dicarboxylate-specific signal transduction histidine kinase